MPTARAAFIRRTYAHLAGAILAFGLLLALLLQFVTPEALAQVLNAVPYSWLLVLGAFMVGGLVAQWWAQSDSSPALQYAGLGLYVVLQALIFLPIMCFAVYRLDDWTIIPTAGIMTLAVFAGLTLTVFTTKQDFSFLGSILWVGAMIALGIIVVAVLFKITLGVLFSFAMIALMSGFILYDTSNVMRYYRTDQHVAAALALFADIATLFFYILRVVMAFSNRN
jgi:FtsH-binding integral membrane protein